MVFAFYSWAYIFLYWSFLIFILILPVFQKIIRLVAKHFYMNTQVSLTGLSPFKSSLLDILFERLCTISESYVKQKRLTK